MQQIRKTISDFLSAAGPLPVLAPSASASEAIALMRQRKCSCVLVVDAQQRLRGIFTERDFLNRIAAAERRPEGTPLQQVMTADPETLGPTDCISYAINMMAVGGFRNIPIIDEGGNTVGLLNARDLLGHLDTVFAELVEANGDDSTFSEWDDIGGG